MRAASRSVPMLLLLVLLSPACSDGGGVIPAPSATPTPPSPAPPAEVQGDYAGPTVGAAHGRFSVRATGGNLYGNVAFVASLKLDGGAIVSMKGSGTILDYQFAVDGGGYHFGGGQMGCGGAGFYTGPHGGGAFLGEPPGDPTASFLCGTFQGDRSGDLALGLRDTCGIAAMSGGGSDEILNVGSWDGSSVTLEYPGGTSLTGTVQGGSASGTWTSPSGSSGTWSATEAACVH